MKVYDYSTKQKAWFLFVHAAFYYLVFPLLALLTFGILAIAVLSFILPDREFPTSITFETMSTVFIVMIYSFIGPQIAFNQFANIKTDAHGIWVQCFLFKNYWKFISWDNILGITSSNIPTVNFWSVWIVGVQKLDIWHRLLSLAFLTGTNPGFAITPGMQNYQELLDLISEKLGVETPKGNFVS